MPFLKPTDQASLEFYMYFLHHELLKSETDIDNLKLIQSSLTFIEEVFDTHPDYEMFIADTVKQSGTKQDNSVQVQDAIQQEEDQRVAIEQVTTSDDTKNEATSNEVEGSTDEEDEDEYYNRLGIKFNSKKEYMKGIEQYTKAIELNPNEATYWCNRGLTYLLLNDHERCIEDCETAVALDNQYFKAYGILGKAALETKRYDLAVKSFTFGLSIEPHNVTFQRYLKEADEKWNVEQALSALDLSTETIQNIEETEENDNDEH